MSADASNAEDSRELEDLFDSIALAARDPAAVPANDATCAALLTSTTDDNEACQAASKVLNSVGQLTRQLHDTLAELGYDKQLQECTGAMLPDARERLAYVVTMTEQAASRSLNAVELATPEQESLAADAQSLAGRWDATLRGESSVDEFKVLAHETRDYLGAVPARTDATRDHLREIMMAQEFQDLTGQVLKRITDLASDLERQLVMLLVEHAPAPINRPEARGLLNGPAMGASSDVVANQAQVDDLLESLGF